MGPRAGLEVLVKRKNLDHPVCSTVTVLTVLPKDSTVMTFIFFIYLFISGLFNDTVSSCEHLQRWNPMSATELCSARSEMYCL